MREPRVGGGGAGGPSSAGSLFLDSPASPLAGLEGWCLLLAMKGRRVWRREGSPWLRRRQADCSPSWRARAWGWYGGALCGSWLGGVGAKAGFQLLRCCHPRGERRGGDTFCRLGPRAAEAGWGLGAQMGRMPVHGNGGALGLRVALGRFTWPTYSFNPISHAVRSVRLVFPFHG